MSGFWAGFGKQRDKNRDLEGEANKRRQDAETRLLGHIKTQKLEEHLKVLDHPKVKQEDRLEHIVEILRRHGDPHGIIDSNSGGGYRSGPYDPNYKNSYWKSIGGVVDKDKKYITQKQVDERRYGRK